MAVLLTTARNLVRSLLNSSTTYGTNDDTKRHPDAEIDDALRQADAKVVNLILNTPGHPRRAQYLTATSVAHAGLIPAHTGDIGTVLVNGKAATPKPAAEIERLRSNVLNLVDIGPYYDIVDQRLFFAPAGTATIDLGNYQDSGTTLQAPDEYLGFDIADALAYLFGKEGSETPTAQHFAAIAESIWKMIPSGAVDVPRVIAYQNQ